MKKILTTIIFFFLFMETFSQTYSWDDVPDNLSIEWNIKVSSTKKKHWEIIDAEMKKRGGKFFTATQFLNNFEHRYYHFPSKGKLVIIGYMNKGAGTIVTARFRGSLLDN